MRNKSNEVKEFSEIVDIISRCDTIRIEIGRASCRERV